DVEVLATPLAGNKPPVAVDDANVTTKNTSVSGTVASNDSDPDNNTPLTFSTLGSLVTGLTLNADGTYTYVPATNFVGTVSQKYKVCDSGSPVACDTATLVITVLEPANQKPLATDDITQTPQDKPVSGNVLPNDLDPEGGVLTVSTTPTTPPTKGTVVLNADGSYTYTPNPGVTGTDKFCYQVCDNGNPSQCDTACVTINILPLPTLANDKPVATDDNSQTYQNTPVVIVVKANDFDPDGNSTLGAPTKLSDPVNGTVVFNADGTVTYTPTTGFVGKDSFTYRICDNGSPSLCDTATVDVEVLATPLAGNKPPVAVDDANVTTKNTSVSGTVASNDSDPDNNTPLTFSTLGSMVTGLTLNADGTYTYVPATNFVGTVSQKYKVCDSGSPVACDTATLVITVLEPANQKPIATDDITQTLHDTPVSGNVLPNDFDPDGGILTVSTTPTTPPTKGTVVLNADGSYTYTPNPRATGTDKFCYQVCDNGNPSQCDTACVTINIFAFQPSINNKPIATDDNSQTYQNTTVRLVVKANDFDLDASGTPNGTLGAPTKLSDPVNGTVVFNADGTVTYTPTTGFVGKDSFTYRICDNGSPSLCDTATVSVEVLPTPLAGNKPPVAVDDANVTAKNTSVSGTVASNDSDPDNNTPLTFSTLGSMVTGLTLNADGTYTYVPATNFVGTVSQKYKVCDSGSPVACDTATLVITVLDSTNQKPIATDDITQTPQDKPVSGNVLPNDLDPEGGVLTVSTTPTTPPTKGTVVLNADGSYTYTPNPGVTGTDKFCYQVCDNGNPSQCDTACVTINILPLPTLANDKPVATDDNSQTYQNTPVVIVVKANDFDPDGNGTLGAPTKLSDPVNGTVVFNADGTVTYTPTTGFVGKDSFTYRICDNGSPSLCDTATVSVEVLATPLAGNKPPVAVDDANVTTKNTSVSGTVASNDSDPDNNTPLTFSTLGSMVTGLTLNADGTYTYVPATNFVGTVSQKYKVCDSGSPVACDTATLVITVLEPANNVCLLPKAYLQGALFGVVLPDTLMRDDLRTKGLIPVTSPYPAMGMSGITNANTTTLSVVGPTSPAGANAIVDWVFVELRSGNDSTLVVDSRSALIQRDGDIVDVDGVSSVKFSQAGSGNYYVVIRHRNHLGVMSQKTALNESCTVIDFRKANTPTFTFSSASINQAQVVVEQGRALWAGNALYTNTLDNRHEVIFQGSDNDVNVIYQQVINATGNIFVSPFYKLKGYYAGDINLNGEVIFQGTTNDVEFIYQNVIKNHPGNVLVQPFFKIKEQIP
ncbi:Ig-like domain-containing protein, partial [Runella salmonicolor]